MKEQFDVVLDKLMQIAVGGCTCHTKTPMLDQHKPHCKYRLAVEAGEIVANIRDQQSTSKR